MAKVLLIDDDELVIYALGRYLRKMGHEVIELNNGSRIKKAISSNNPDIVVTDIIMPDAEGFEVIISIRQDHPLLPIIAMSGGSRLVDANYLASAEKLGANATLEKPFDEAELNRLIEELTR